MRLLFWRKDHLTDMMLFYLGSDTPSKEDLDIIRSSKIQNAQEHYPGFWEFKATMKVAQDLKKRLPNWELSIVRDEFEPATT